MFRYQLKITLCLIIRDNWILLETIKKILAYSRVILKKTKKKTKQNKTKQKSKKQTNKQKQKQETKLKTNKQNTKTKQRKTKT